MCDEFVTALREAETLDIPVVLGDASQNDTLNSIQTVISSEMFDPWVASRGAMFLAFSALGVYAKESYEALSATIDSEVLRRSEWVSIPQTYTRSKPMLKTLGPFLARHNKSRATITSRNTIVEVDMKGGKFNNFIDESYHIVYICLDAQKYYTSDRGTQLNTLSICAGGITFLYYFCVSTDD